MRPFLILNLILSISLSAQALDLDSFLKAVMQKHRGIQANDQSKDAAEFHRISTDIDLSPTLVLSGGYLDDQRPNLITPTFYSSRTVGWQYSAGLSEKFISGTNASVTMNLSQYGMNTYNLAGTPATSTINFGTGALQAALSQSLWKDAFGHGIRLREARELQIQKLNNETYNLQTKQILIDAESAFWDLLYLQEEYKLRTDSLQRAKKIETWVRNRSSNGIGDKSDVLNAQGLVASRELQLIQTEDDIVATRRKVSDMMELTDNQDVPSMEGNLGQVRVLDSLIAGQSGAGRRVRLDSYLSVLDSKAKGLMAQEAAEAVKPDLVLSGSYSTNSFDTTNGITGAYNNVYSTNLPTINVGLKFTWLLDSDLKNATRESARRDALASTLKMERQLLESDSAWQEINRRHREMTREVEASRIVTEVQMKKAAAERERLEKGRTITLQVVTAEQDAAESALTLVRLEAMQRKLEAQARLYVNLGEVK